MDTSSDIKILKFLSRIVYLAFTIWFSFELFNAIKNKTISIKGTSMSAISEPLLYWFWCSFFAFIIAVFVWLIIKAPIKIDFSNET